MFMKKTMLLAVMLGLSALPMSAISAEYTIDKEGQHASINFKINHLGYSFIVGRFDDFEGSFNYDKSKPESTVVKVVINTDSVNSNHSLRDNHLRKEDFLFVSEFPQATFVSTGYESANETQGKLIGQLTLRGITKDVVIEVSKVGEGDDPWGGYRAGFEGTTTLALDDYGIPKKLGPSTTTVEMSLFIEGVKQ